MSSQARSASKTPIRDLPHRSGSRRTLHSEVRPPVAPPTPLAIAAAPAGVVELIDDEEDAPFGDNDVEDDGTIGGGGTASIVAIATTDGCIGSYTLFAHFCSAG